MAGPRPLPSRGDFPRRSVCSKRGIVPALIALATTATPRTSPEPSDLFLFVAAALAVWFVRRSLRKRFRNRRDD